MWTTLFSVGFFAFVIRTLYKTFVWSWKWSPDSLTKGNPSDRIKLHIFRPPRDSPTPNLSPPCIKLQLFLQASQLPHTVVLEQGTKGAPKGKMPYISHGDSKIPDSELCIRYLLQTYAVGQDTLGDIRVALNPAEQARTTAIQRICDDGLYFALACLRWLPDDSFATFFKLVFAKIPKILAGPISTMVRNQVKNQLYLQGTARHSINDILFLAKRDVDALSEFLGDQDFFLGSKLTVADIIVFAVLDNLLSFELCGLKDYVAGKKNLLKFDARLRHMYFKKSE